MYLNKGTKERHSQRENIPQEAVDQPQENLTPRDKVPQRYSYLNKAYLQQDPACSTWQCHQGSNRALCRWSEHLCVTLSFWCKLEKVGCQRIVFKEVQRIVRAVFSDQLFCPHRDLITSYQRLRDVQRSNPKSRFNPVGKILFFFSED